MKTLHIDSATLHIEVATLHTVYTSFIHGLYIVYKAAKSFVSIANKSVAKDACKLWQKNTVQGQEKNIVVITNLTNRQSIKTLHINRATLHIEVATLHTVYTSFIHGLYIVYKAAKSPVFTANKSIAKGACEMRQKNTVQGRGKKLIGVVR